MSSDEREDFELDDRDLLAAAGLLKRLGSKFEIFDHH